MMFERMKKAHSRVKGWQEKRAEKRHEERGRQIERLKRETQYHKAKRAYQKARTPSAFESFFSGFGPANSDPFGFGTAPRRRRKPKKTRRSKSRRGRGKTITIRL